METRYVRQVLPSRTNFFRLFETTGWNRAYQLSEAALFSGIQHSWFFVSAFHEDRLVGFGRMISDGVMHARILDMIVHPDYQGMGIGRQFLDVLRTYADEHDIRDLQLFAATGKADFYQRYGFSRRSKEVPGMEIKRC